MLSQMLAPNVSLMLRFLLLLPLRGQPELVQLLKKSHGALTIARKSTWTISILSK